MLYYKCMDGCDVMYVAGIPHEVDVDSLIKNKSLTVQEIPLEEYQNHILMEKMIRLMHCGSFSR